MMADSSIILLVPKAKLGDVVELFLLYRFVEYLSWLRSSTAYSGLGSTSANNSWFLRVSYWS